MYANRISVSLSEKEGYLKLECIAPRIGEESKDNSLIVLESCDIVMSREMMINMKNLIENVLSESEKAGE